MISLIPAMKRPLVMLPAACAFSLSLGYPIARAEIKEQIVAVVNDDIITFSELDRILSPIFEQYERIYSGAELFSMLQKARRDVLNHLIEEKLILAEAEKQNVCEMLGDDFAKEVGKSIAEVKSKFPSEEAFLKELEREGVTLDEFRAKQEEKTLVGAMLSKEVYSTCSVSPGEVLEYYRKHPDEFTEKEKVHVSQIWIKDNPEKPEEAAERAAEAFAKLEAGAAFADVAKEYSSGPYASRGGDWGFVSHGHWNEALEAVAFSLEPGQSSSVCRTNLGCHIIMVHEKKPASLKPLDKVYSEIERKIFQEKAAKRRKEWIARLRQKAYIAVK